MGVKILRYLVKFINVNLCSCLCYIFTVLEQWVFNGEISIEILFACVMLSPSQCVKGDDFLV